MPKKLRVGVLMGGPSSEREISLITGKAISENLNPKRYLVLPIEVTKQGQLFMHQTPLLKEKNPRRLDLSKKEECDKLDVIFIAMHGKGGEDGCIQGMLECLGIPYTGSGVLASALAMDKVKTALVYEKAGLPMPAFFYFTKKEWDKNKKNILEKIKKDFTFPLVIKPTDQGSSVGVYIVKEEKNLEKFIKKSLLTSDNIMAQEWIKGEEATCGVLEKNDESFALPPTHILANLGEFYDYKSKYADGGSTHICPADFPKEINKKLQEMAIKAHQALGCRGMSRTDFFVTPEGKIYAIETNTIPGMTPVSLLPEAAKKKGIRFSEMLNLIIKASIK